MIAAIKGNTTACILAAICFILVSGCQEKPIDFSSQVKPILNKHCISCHGGVKRNGNYSVLFRSEALHALDDPSFGLLADVRLVVDLRTSAEEDGPPQVTGSVEEGVHLAADTFGRLYAASGASVGSLGIEIAGIRNLDDYAATLNYLEGMTLVRSVALEQVVGDTMRLQLAVRGDAMTLRRALALDNRLVPSTAAEGVPAERLQLRLNR